MIDYKKLLTGLLSTAYKMDSEKITELLDGEDDAVATAALLDADKDRVSTLTTKPGQTFQDGFKAAKKEVLSSFEKEVKAKYGVDTDVTGVELIEAVVKAKAGTPGGKGLTDDDVKKHPVYQSLESKLTTSLNDKEKEWETKFNAREQELTKAQTLAKAKAKVLEELEAMKPVLSSNATIAQNLKDTFANQFAEYDFEFQGDRIVVMKDGKVFEDAHGNSAKLSDLVKAKAPLYFEFQKSNGGANAGNSNDGGQGGNTDPAAYPAGINKPANLEDLQKIVYDEKIPLEDRNKVMAAWESENP